jgi:hypothetical protein
MIKEIKIYKHHFLAVLTAVKKPAVIIPALGLISFSSCQLGILLLIGLITLDFITGVYASWNLWKDSKIESNFWKYGFSSNRVRMSVVKAVTYFLFILCAYGIEVIFKIKSFGINAYSEHEITLTLFTIAISCAIEFYSIFFENLPKAGFDIGAQVTTIFNKIKSAVLSVKDIAQNDDNSAK